jgi:putative effector of murein hydrolase LrgA (UPF0299 family)
MHALIRFYLELALLRRGPQDLPASSALVALLALTGVVVGALGGMGMFGGLAPALGANLLDLVLSMTMLFVLLQFRNHPGRWLQTAAAFLGLGLLASVVMLSLNQVLLPLGAASLVVLIDIVIVVWLHMALGGVLRHALEVPLPLGIGIVFTYTLMAFSLISRVFPPLTVES